MLKDLDDPERQFARGLHLLNRGDYRQGFHDLEARWRMTKFLCETTVPPWRGEDLAGKSIIVLHEQGLGDTVCMARYLPLLAQRGAKVLVECLGSLAMLLRGVEGVHDVVVSKDKTSPVDEIEECWLPGTDYRAFFMSLPGIFGTTPETIPLDTPYLSVDSDDYAMFTERFTNPEILNVGIAWQGNPCFANDRERSFPLALFHGIAQNRLVRLVSLQSGFGERQIDRVDFDVVRVPEIAEGLHKTAALIAALDLVITCDSVVAHVAGALGKMTWLANYAMHEDKYPDFRWTTRHPTQNPWYPDVRVFRQPSPGDWDSVFAAMEAAISGSE